MIDLIGKTRQQAEKEIESLGLEVAIYDLDIKRIAYTDTINNFVEELFNDLKIYLNSEKDYYSTHTPNTICICVENGKVKEHIVVEHKMWQVVIYTPSQIEWMDCLSKQEADHLGQSKSDELGYRGSYSVIPVVYNCVAFLGVRGFFKSHALPPGAPPQNDAAVDLQHANGFLSTVSYHKVFTDIHEAIDHANIVNDQHQPRVIAIWDSSGHKRCSILPIEVQIRDLQKKLDVINPSDISLAIGLTNHHSNRIKEGKSIDAWTDRVQGAKPYTKVSTVNCRYFFEIVHHVDQNGNGTIDSLELPSFKGLKNLVDVIEEIVNHGPHLSV